MSLISLLTTLERGQETGAWETGVYNFPFPAAAARTGGGADRATEVVTSVTLPVSGEAGQVMCRTWLIGELCLLQFSL